MHLTFLLLLWNLINFSLITTTSTIDNILNEKKINKKIQEITQENINYTEKNQIIRKLKSALHSNTEKTHSKIKIQKHQNIINNFPSIVNYLHIEKNLLNKSNLPNNKNYITSTNDKLQKYQIKINHKLIKLNQELQHEQNLTHNINNSLILLSQKHAEIKKELNDITQKISLLNTKKQISPIEQVKYITLQAEKEAKQFKVTELESDQFSTDNQQEISKSHIELLKNKYDQLNKKSKELEIQINDIQQQEISDTIKKIETLKKNTEKYTIFPKQIIQELQINHHLSQNLKKQIEYINSITLQQKEIANQTLQVKETLSKLLKQIQWIHQSPILGEILRTQISKLPKSNIYRIQQLNKEINQIRKNRLQYEKKINKLSLISLQNKKNLHITKTLTNNHKHILNTQYNIQRKLLNSLLNNCDIQILELTKLKIAHEQLKKTLKEANKKTYHYLLWVPDIHPINLLFFYKVYQNLYLLLNTNNLLQLKDIIKIIFIKNTKNLILFLLILLFICYFRKTYHYHYYFFLIQNQQKFKKTKKNYLLLILKNILGSSIISLPIPMLWMMIGNIFSQTWEHHPFFASIGKAIIKSVPVLWTLIVISYFISKNGLFINQFKWEKEKIKKAFHNYTVYIITITILLTILISFNHYNDKKYYDTLALFFFIILCTYLTFITYKIKKANLPLYINKQGSENNIINYTFWNVITLFPIISAFASCCGYFSISQKLLINLEISLIILLLSSIVYYTLKNWIIIQRNKIIPEYNINDQAISTKKNINKKTSLSTSYIKNIINFNPIKNKIKKNTNHSNTNLDIITIQSLQLTRFILIIITYSTIFFIWSEFHYAFKFLEKILLWDITSTIRTTNNIQPITLKIILISILILTITIKITKNSQSLLTLTILQYLKLTPATNYAIITVTKYTLILLGIVLECSYIGLEWSKLQWLIAAMGVGLGFGLQEIFANFISGLIILFEKPIRIGDTITICNLTGNITQINIRATTITDRDHKEIIVPNKEFITKKFINWSLSDTITRVVLKVPAPPKVNITQITQVLLEAVTNCPLVLQIPKPEIYLINIEKGIPIFEIRMHTSKMSNRMPLRHQVHILIIHFYKKYGLYLPFPHIHTHNN